MPQALTTAQLIQYRNTINTGGVAGAIQVYNALYSQGYNYAGWASGVASGDTLTGQSAIVFYARLGFVRN